MVESSVVPISLRVGAKVMSQAEAALREEVDRTLVVYEGIIGRSASRSWEMLERLGYVGALSRLVVSADLQQGFKILRDRNRLADTFEAVVVRHRDLFTKEVVEAAQWRLDHPSDLL